MGRPLRGPGGGGGFPPLDPGDGGVPRFWGKGGRGGGGGGVGAWGGRGRWGGGAGAAAKRRWWAEWPIPRPARWVNWVNEPQTGAELEALRRCVTRGQPFGSGARGGGPA